MSTQNPWRFSVAPMMDWTDRTAASSIAPWSRHALLYTEMVTTGAVIHGDRDRLALFAGRASGGAATGWVRPVRIWRKPRDWRRVSAYDEINLNCGCPS